MTSVWAIGSTTGSVLMSPRNTAAILQRHGRLQRLAFGVAYNGQDNYSATKSELLFLANAYADLGTWWCITPFIGAGVGTYRVTISGFTDNGVTNLQLPPPPAVPYAGGPPGGE